MELPTSLSNLNPLLVSLAAVLLALIALLLLGIALAAQRRILRRYRLLLYGPKGVALEELLLNQASALEAVQDRLRMLERDNARLQEAVAGHVQHVGLVRFQAFPEVGGDLSFSLALLDGRRNGVVITCIHGRQQSLLYAKPIEGGTSSYVLTDEEKAAIAQALTPKSPSRIA